MQYAYALNLALLLLIAWQIHLSRNHNSKFLDVSVLLLTAGSGLIAAALATSFISIVLAFSYVWAVINNARLLTRRRENEYNSDVVLEGWLTFMGWYLLLLVFDYLVLDSMIVPLFNYASLVVAVIMFGFTVYHAARYRITRLDNLGQKESPPVTLAIPARNETHAIEATLRRAIASDYEKLEILVIDDCSQDRTPQIIRDLAHDGVRFIEGRVPTENWLGKNASYKVLTDEASGDYILFTGVDVHLAKDSVSKLVSFAVTNDYDMVSVMPQRVGFDFLANFLQTTRYFFQFVLPWEIIPGRAVLSSVWLIKRDTLIDLGGFDEVSTMVVPERYFANKLGNDDKYYFLVSDGYLGITSRKRTSSQLETATRTIYPQLESNPIFSVAVSFALVMFLVLPFVNAVATGAAVSVVTVAILTITNVIIYTRFNASTWYIGMFNFVFIASLQALMVQWSMLKYEFSGVNWKDRNICIPVLNPPLKRQRSNPLTQD